MRRGRRIHLVETTCRRCGKPLLTASRSLMGADNAKMVYGSICSECMGTDERDQMVRAIGNETVRRMT